MPFYLAYLIFSPHANVSCRWNQIHSLAFFTLSLLSLSLFPLLSLFGTFIKDAIFSHFSCFFFFIYSIQDKLHLFFLFFFFFCALFVARLCVRVLSRLADNDHFFPCSCLLSLSLFFSFIVAIKRKSSIQHPKNQPIPFKLKKPWKKRRERGGKVIFFCARVEAMGKNMIIPCRL